MDGREVLIIGAGIGGLTLGLMLHRRGIACRVYEAAPELRPLGVGINILPHASKELGELGLEAALTRVAILTKEAAFFNRFGQLIYREPLGRHAGYDWPQYSIHRGDLQVVLADAFRERAGADRLQLGWKCVRAEDGTDGATAHFVDGATGAPLVPQRGRVVVGCDGVHSVLRKQFHPNEGDPRVLGRQHVARRDALAADAVRRDMVRAGWLNPGKMVIYPIRDRIDAQGRQLVNWLAEIETPQLSAKRDWNRPGRHRRLHRAVRATGTSTGCDVPALIRAADAISSTRWSTRTRCRWTFGRVTLARRCGASDGAARLERRRAGDPRCAGARRRLDARRDPADGPAGLRGARGCRRRRRWCWPTARCRRTRSCARSRCAAATGRSSASRT